LPVAGVTVSVSGSGATATTASDGTYTLASIPVGFADVIFSKTGYDTLIVVTNVITLTSVDAILSLTSSAPPIGPTGYLHGDYNAFFLNSSKDVFEIETLQIAHPSFSQTYWIVRNAVAGITAILEDGSTETFVYYPLQIKKVKSQHDDMDQELEIQLGDLGDVIPIEMDNVNLADDLGTKPTVTYRTYRSDDLSKPLSGPFHFEIVNLSMNEDGSAFSARAPRLNQVTTGEIYDLNRFAPLKGFL